MTKPNDDFCSGNETSSQSFEGVQTSPVDNNGGMLSRALSRLSTGSAVSSDPPPDGGLKAWLCVLGTHLVVMNTWGTINSFGVFQSHYVASLQRSPSDISWVGSIEIFFLFFVGAFSGRLTDAGYFRPVAVIGSILVVVGSMTTSVATQYWQVFLSQGVCLGLGNGFLFCPVVALLSTYFAKRRSLAIGIAACGSASGGIIFPLVVREMLPRVGFGWAVRTIGFIQAGTLIVALLCLKPRVPPRKTGNLVDLAAFKELEYSFYAVGTFLLCWGAFIAFFYIAAYSRDIRGLSYSTSLDLVMIMNGTGIIGRLLPNHLADRFGSLTVFVPTAGAGALLLYCWIPIASPAGLYGWAAVCGIALGGIQAMFPAATASLTTDPRKQGTRIGMIFTIVSFSVLTGPPIAGALLSALNGRYIGAQLFAGSSLALGTGFIALARESKRRRTQGSTWSKV